MGLVAVSLDSASNPVSKAVDKLFAVCGSIIHFPIPAKLSPLHQQSSQVVAKLRLSLSID